MLRCILLDCVFDAQTVTTNTKQHKFQTKKNRYELGCWSCTFFDENSNKDKQHFNLPIWGPIDLKLNSMVPIRLTALESHQDNGDHHIKLDNKANFQTAFDWCNFNIRTYSSNYTYHSALDYLKEKKNPYK